MSPRQSFKEARHTGKKTSPVNLAPPRKKQLERTERCFPGHRVSSDYEPSSTPGPLAVLSGPVYAVFSCHSQALDGAHLARG